MGKEQSRPGQYVMAKTLEEIGQHSDDELRDFMDQLRERSLEAKGLGGRYNRFRVSEAHYGTSCIQELLKTSVHGVKTDGFHYHGDKKIADYELEFITKAHEIMLGKSGIDLDTIIYATLGDDLTAGTAIKHLEQECPEYVGLLSRPGEREKRFAYLCSASPEPVGEVLEEITSTLHIIGRDHFNLPEEVIEQTIAEYALGNKKVQESLPGYKTHLVEAEQRVSSIVKEAYESGNKIRKEELNVLKLWAEQEYHTIIDEPLEYFDHLFTRELYRNVVVEALFDWYENEAVSPHILERVEERKEEFRESVKQRFKNTLVNSKTQGVDITLLGHIYGAEEELVEEVFSGVERVNQVYDLWKDLYEILPDKEYHADIEPLFLRYCEMNGLSSEYVIKD
ncbi:hypothetical protein GOV10_04640 [Candidatus Woesearchaeota archaeon]|nr:hypothetical protein [Candidatus Woesearchaeota archaeon]